MLIRNKNTNSMLTFLSMKNNDELILAILKVAMTIKNDKKNILRLSR